MKVIKLECDQPIVAGRIGRSMQYVIDHIDRHMCLEELASVAALSPFYFSRKFKRKTGLAPMRYVLCRRVSAAMVLLATTNFMHIRISDACGFASESHFCTSFKNATGMTPRQYRIAKQMA